MWKMSRRSAIFVFAFMSILAMISFFSILPAHAAGSVQNVSYIRVIHASPYVGTADVFVDGKLLLSSFQFASVTDYVPLPAGPHRVQISLVGKGINASALSQVLSVQAGYVYTVAALGTQPDALSLQVFVDNNQVMPNLAKVRIYHLAPDAGQVNVNIGGDFTFGADYQNASSYVNESTGPCLFTFADPQFNQTLDLTAALRSNTVTSVFAVGLFQGSPKVQLVEAQTPGIPGSPNTGSDPRPISTFSPLPWCYGLLLAVVLLFFCQKKLAYVPSRNR
jgi:Domain of unknown function (DUF4397)